MKREPGRGGGRGEGWAGTSVTHVGPVCRSTMVAGTRCLLALLLHQVLLGGAAGLIPELGRRKFAASSGRSSSQPSEDVLSEFELRLLSMFGLKQRPTPSRDAVVPPYMLELYRRHSGQPGAPAPDHRLERAASLANTVRSFHHEGEARSRGMGAGAGSHPAKRPTVGKLQASLEGQLGLGMEAVSRLCLVRTFPNLAVTHCRVWWGSQGFPTGKSAPFSWLAARRATPPPGTGEKSSDGKDEGKRHTPSQLNVQEFQRGNREGGGQAGISLPLFGSPHSINLPLLLKPGLQARQSQG